MLLELPPELQRMVVEELRLPRLPIGTERYLNSNSAFTKPRSALLNLCLTSHHFKELAEPLLYESIALTRDAQFVPLLNALLIKRERRTWIRSLACPMCLVEETDTLAIVAQWNQLVAPRKDQSKDEREQQALQLVNLKVDHILEDVWWADSAFCDQLLAVILCLATRLEDVLLQVPTDLQLMESMDEYLLHVYIALYKVSKDEETDMFQWLRSVRLQPTRTMDNPVEAEGWEIMPENVEPGTDPRFGIHPFCLPAIELQHVEEMEYIGDDGDWFRILEPNLFSLTPWVDDKLPRELKRFRCLTSLKLCESRTAPAYLRNLLQQAHSLKTFHYTTRPQEWRIDYSNYSDFTPLAQCSINEALLPASKTVEELVLGTVQRPWAADDDKEYEHVEVVSVLGTFERLTRLTIDIRWLIPMTSFLQGDEEEYVPLHESLPSTIEYLELHETWTNKDLEQLYDDRERERRAMAWIQAALRSLLTPGDKHGMKLARLKQVTLVAMPAYWTYGACRIRNSESYKRNDGGEENGDVKNKEDGDKDPQSAPFKTDDGVAQMKRMFTRYGIDFTVDWVHEEPRFPTY